MSEISQRTSSASTAAKAIVVEKANAEILLIGVLDAVRPDLVDDVDLDAKADWSDGELCGLSLGTAWPDRSGKILWKTRVATDKKVTRKGKEEKSMVVEACVLR